MGSDQSQVADRERPPDVSVRELAIVFIGFTCVAMVMTLPLWRHPTRWLPSGHVDALLNTWILAWDAQRIPHGLRGLWDAPIFYPYHNTLAFSENLLGLAWFVAPVYWFSGNPLLTYNVAFTLSFVVSGIGMYLLATTLTRSRKAGIVAATFYAFCPYRFTEMSHIQQIATGWLPGSLYGLHRYFATGRRAWLAVLAVCCWLQALSNSYVAYFMALPLVVVALVGVWRDKRRARRMLDLGVAALLIVLSLAPIVWKYYQVRSEYRQVRGPVEITMWSADVRSYVLANSSIGIWRWLRPGAPAEPEKELFPGATVLVLSAAALWHLIKRRDELGQWSLVYGAIAVAAVAFSLGPEVHVWGRAVARGPYELLLRIVPGMTGMRAPARFAIVVFLSLAVMVGCGMRAVLTNLRRPVRSLATVVCVVLLLAESWAVPLPGQTYDPRGRPADRAVAAWLRARPAGAVLHLPVRTFNFQELHYQYATLFHADPIVNGMSGYDSPLHRLFRETYSPLYDNGRPSDVVRMLRSIGIRFVVVHLDDYNVTQLAADEHHLAVALFRTSGQLVEEQRLLDAHLFELQPAPPISRDDAATRIEPDRISLSVSEGSDRAGFLQDGNPDTRWIGGQTGPGWFEVVLDRSYDVARIDLQLAERSLTDYPRELQIDATDGRGEPRTLYHASPYPEFLAAFVRDPLYPAIRISLPPNSTTKLTIRETGLAAGRWWSVHEIALWRRR